MTQDTSSTPQDPQEAVASALRLLGSEDGSPLALELLDSLNAGKDTSKGVTDEFLDSLERVDVSALKNKDLDCPICTSRFADDEFPLVVKLPCHLNNSTKNTIQHMFDMECIAPWLKVHSTCPMCRFDVLGAVEKRKERLADELRRLKEDDDEDEDEDWDVYG